MKSILFGALVFSSVSVYSQSLVLRAPVEYSACNFSFSAEVAESGEDADEDQHLGVSESQTNKTMSTSTAKTVKRGISIGSEHVKTSHVGINANVDLTGKVSGGANYNDSTDHKMFVKSFLNFEKDKSEENGAYVGESESKAHRTKQTSSSNTKWTGNYLNFDLYFYNLTDNVTYSFEKGKPAYVYVTHKKWGEGGISFALDADTKAQIPDLLPSGDRRIRVHVKYNVTAKTDIEKLRKVTEDDLKELTVRLDDSFPFLAEGRHGIENFGETRSTVVSFLFGTAEKYRPIPVRARDPVTRKLLTLKETIEAAKDYLYSHGYGRDIEKDYLTYTNVSLCTVDGFSFGQVDDGCVVFAVVKDVAKGTCTPYLDISNQMLDSPLSRQGGDMQIGFIRQDVDELSNSYDFPAIFRERLIERIERWRNVDAECASRCLARVYWSLDMKEKAIEEILRIKHLSEFKMRYRRGDSPLDFAVVQGDLKAVRTLLKCPDFASDANTLRLVVVDGTTNSMMGTTLSLAIKIDSPEIIQVLTSHHVVMPKGRFIMCDAACFGARKVLSREIAERSPVDVIDDKLESPLSYAVKFDRYEICTNLVKAGADYNYDRCTSCLTADKKTSCYIKALRAIDMIRDGRFSSRGWPQNVSAEKVKEWVSAGVDPNSSIGGSWRGGSWSLYSWAVMKKDDALVRWLIEHGADIEDTSRPEPLRQSELHGYTAEMLAVDKGSTNLVVTLCNVAKDPVAEKKEMMKYALDKAEKYEVCKFLVDYGADVNAKSEDNGFTPLMWATKVNDTNMVDRLLSKGVDVNAVYKASGKTALCMAIEKGNSDAVRLLLPKASKEVLIKGEWRELNFYQFAAMHLKDRQLLETIFSDKKAHDADGDGITPLMAAAYAGNLEAVKFLVDTKKEKADDHDKSFWGGNTALDYAEKQKMSDVVAYLKLLQGEVKK